MVVPIALKAIGRSGARRCRSGLQDHSRPRSGPVAMDTPVPSRIAGRPAARQRPLRDAEIDGAEVSWHSPSEIEMLRTDSRRVDRRTRVVDLVEGRSLTGL